MPAEGPPVPPVPPTPSPTRLNRSISEDEIHSLRATIRWVEYHRPHLESMPYLGPEGAELLECVDRLRYDPNWREEFERPKPYSRINRQRE